MTGLVGAPMKGTRMNAVEQAVDVGRFSQLRARDEDGAQAVEYAMIGGLGAGLIGLLWSILKGTGVLDKVVGALVNSLVELLTGWF